MLLPPIYEENFKELLDALRCRDIVLSDNPRQPRYRWFWGDSFFWAYSSEAGLQIYGDKLEEFESIIKQGIAQLEEMDEEIERDG